MRKAVAALALLAVLAGISVWNILYLDRFTARLEGEVEVSRILWEQGDLSGASRALTNALETWREAENYTHVFIRHAEVDCVTDAFYDVFAALNGENASSAGSRFDRLKAHLDSIDAMEHITVKTVF